MSKIGLVDIEGNSILSFLDDSELIIKSEFDLPGVGYLNICDKLDARLYVSLALMNIGEIYTSKVRIRKSILGDSVKFVIIPLQDILVGSIYSVIGNSCVKYNINL